MGMFEIYSSIKNYELYDLIDFKNAYIGWEQDELNPWIEHQVVKEEIQNINDIYLYIICVEKLPNKIIIHHGDNFERSTELSYKDGQTWLYLHGYNKVNNFILKECYACLEYAINGVDKFCRAVAHNKSELCFLEGND